MSNASERRTASRFGLGAERREAWYLRFKGYRILARRLKVEGGRIDLAALGSGTLVLIEVKARNALAIARKQSRRRNKSTSRPRPAPGSPAIPTNMALTQRFDAVFLAPVHYLSIASTLWRLILAQTELRTGKIITDFIK